jgi:hypothetical protein
MVKVIPFKESPDLRRQKMPTRETHARIYQQELSSTEYNALKGLAKQKKVSIQEFVLDRIRAYLGDWRSSSFLDVQEVITKEGSLRIYLWLPYDVCDELERLMKKRGSYVQELARRAVIQCMGPGPEDRAK